MAHPESHFRRIVSEHWRFGVGVLLAALVLLELMLRLFVMPTYPPVELGFDHDDRNCARPVPGSAKVWRPHGLLGKPVVHRVNNLGIRDDVPDLSADLRVAVLGGAGVYGVGLKTTDTLPAALEKIFAARYPDRRIRFDNFGFSGFDLEEQIRELSRLEPIFRPDIVLVALDNESFKPPLCSRRALPVRNVVNDNLALARLIERHLMPVDLVPGNALARHATAAELRRLVTALDRIHVGTLVFAALDDLPDVADGKGRMVMTIDVIKEAGQQMVIPGPGDTCELEDTTTDRTATGDASTKNVLSQVACGIEPFIDGLINDD